MREAGDRHADSDEHTGNTLEAELLPDREPEPVDVADVDDVIEATRDRTGEQREDDEEPRTRTVDSEEGHNRDKAEERPAEGRRAFLGAVRGGAVRGDVLTRAEGKRAKIPGYSMEIAGKTGTAQVALPNGGGYGPNVVASFVGFMPATDPQFTMMVILNDPQVVAGNRFGSILAAPIWRQVAEMMIDDWRIEP
jgi:membrane carboxypeptidase/penicillin-binding protein